MKRRRLLVMVLLAGLGLGLALGPFPQEPAASSCAAPYLEDAEALILERGVTTTVQGRGFVDGCRDGMTCTVGCHSCEYDDPAPEPMKGVGLQLRQHGRTWDLDTADAQPARSNRSGSVMWTFELPRGVVDGRARLLPERGEPVTVQIR